MPEATQTNYIHVDENDGGSRVVFSPADKDLFVLNCKDAVQHVKMGLGWKAVASEIGALIEHVKEWAKTKASLLSSCYATLRDGQFYVVVVPKGTQFDLALSDALTDLDIEIAEKFQILNCDVIQLPVSAPEQLECFLNPRGATIVYPDNES